MSIRTVVFDFGNVLGFFCHRRSAQQLAAYGPAGLSADEVYQFLIESGLEARFESGQLAGQQVLGMLRERFGLKGSDADLAHAFADMFTPNEDVCTVIPRLQGRYRLVLLSNTNDLHYRLFRRQFAETLDRFDHLVVSHEVGVRKPDARIYQHAQALAGCEAGECLFVDDLPANVEAGRAWGWRAIQYQHGHDLPGLLREAGVSLVA